MHSSRMSTSRSLIISPYLVVSHAHPPPRATTHVPREQPCMPLSNQACSPPPPCMPPPEQPHFPPSNHTCPPLEQPCMPPRATMQAPQSNHTPQATMHAPPMNRMTNRCKNITLPKLRLRAVKNCSPTGEHLFYHSMSVNITEELMRVGVEILFLLSTQYIIVTSVETDT